MEGITLGQIALTVTFLVGLISGIGYLKTNLKKWVTDSLKDEFRSLDSRIKDLQKQVNDEQEVFFLSHVETFLRRSKDFTDTNEL